MADRDWFLSFVLGIVYHNRIRYNFKITLRFVKSGNNKYPQPFGLWVFVSVKATAGFEPAMGVLQTPALPLGYVASTIQTAEVTVVA
jgi:hypothetical protein